MKTINIGLIGLGEMGKIHFRNSLFLPEGKLIAVADVEKKSINIAKKMGVKHVYTDYNDLLSNPEIDAVIISLPTFLHMPIAIKAAETGKNILIEKPLSRNVAEGQDILSAVRRNNVKLMVGYPLRFTPQFIDLKNSLESGHLGDVPIFAASIIGSGPLFHRTANRMPRPVPEWWFNKELTGGGALLDLGSHLINLLAWYFGEITSVKCQLGYRYNMDFEDHAMSVMTFKNGTVGTLNAGWFAEYHRIQMDLFGTVEHGHAVNDSASKIGHIKKLVSKRARNISTGYYDELKYFVNCLLNDVNPTPSGEDGLRDIQTIEANYSAFLSNRQEGRQ